VLVATKPLGECFVEQVFLVLASGEQLDRLFFALAVSKLGVKVNQGQQLGCVVLAPKGQDQLVLATRVEINAERHLERLVLVPER